ncbi:MAG: ATP-binding protein [Pirellulales bacterium]
MTRQNDAADERSGTAARRQALLADFGRRALTGTDAGLLLRKAVEFARNELDVEHCDLLELLPDGTALLRAARGWRDGQIGPGPLALNDGSPAARVLREQAPLVIDDLETDERFSAPSLLHEHGVVSSLNVPLYGQARPFGVLGAHAVRRRAFTTDDANFLQTLAHLLSAVMERTSREEGRRKQHLHRAEQMMAIGQVAAGVAHELRNPLTSIKGLVQVNLREAKSRALPWEDLAVIEHEIRRMERTLQTFLDFARPPRPDRKPLDPADVVDRVFALLAGRARKQSVALRFTRKGVISVEADQDQLQQLLLNLVLNALDAMPEGGAVDVEVRQPSDGYAELILRDTGPGIPPHILPKVFETFVSSKETGVGLGLPVSRRIAEDHGGTLSAYNLPGGGACFVLRLPHRG